MDRDFTANLLWLSESHLLQAMASSTFKFRLIVYKEASSVRGSR